MLLLGTSNEHKARACRITADAISECRNDVAKVVAADIVLKNALLPKSLRFGSMGGAALVWGLGAADALDGRIARMGARRYGLVITPHDNNKDPILDKEYNKWMMGAFTLRALEDGHLLYAKSLYEIQRSVEDRDARMERSRSTASNVMATGAISINKYKTGMQDLCHGFAMSPMARTSAGRAAILSGYVTSAFMGEVGLLQADAKHHGQDIPSVYEAAHAVIDGLDIDGALNRLIECKLL